MRNIIHLRVTDTGEGLSHRAWPVTFQSLLYAPSSFHLPHLLLLLPFSFHQSHFAYRFTLLTWISVNKRGVQNPAGGWHPSRNLVCMGSGRSQPLHIHMLSILADLSVAAADRLREDALLHQCMQMCISWKTFTSSCLSKGKVSHKLTHVRISASFRLYI